MITTQPQNTAEIDQTFDALVDGLASDPVATAGSASAARAGAKAAEADADSRLGKRVVSGLIVGFVLVTILGFVLMTARAPGQPALARLGVAAFFGAWTSPFAGLSMAVGYHLLVEEQH